MARPYCRTAKPDPGAGACDLLIIGGGINGAGIARDAAGRGLSVILCEKDDLAQGTSSRSGKLIHGGLRYLEYYEFRLVREALIERERLLKIAPHIIRPLRFVLPHNGADRPAWLVRLGLFVYDHLGGRETLPGTTTLDFRSAPEGIPLKADYGKGFAYSDCWVDDARLVVLNALDAAERGARILTRTRCTSARREDGYWCATLKDESNGTERQISARCIVNAGGPWVGDVAGRIMGGNAPASVRLVKGSHIVVRKFWDGDHAYLFQNHDRRVIFTIPHAGDFALIGTTDIPFTGSPEDATATAGEVSYLLDAVNRYFRNPLREADIVDSFAGVRSLFDDGQGNPSAVTRDYVLELDGGEGAPLLNIFGGKITTYRKLAEHALAKLAPFFPAATGPWTATEALPGGDPDAAAAANLPATLCHDRPWLPPELARHYAEHYGTRAKLLLQDAADIKALGRKFGPLLYAAEAHYLYRCEWARTATDILWRRTRHHLRMSAAEITAFRNWFAATYDQDAA